MPEQDEPRLIARPVTLLVSEDTNELWEAMAARLGLEDFDALAQVLIMYGAFLVASADQGYLENLNLDVLGPDNIRAVVWPWLRRQHGSRRVGPDQIREREVPGEHADS